VAVIAVAVEEMGVVVQSVGSVGSGSGSAGPAVCAGGARGRLKKGERRLASMEANLQGEESRTYLGKRRSGRGMLVSAR
jgi:hypothetical protein